MKKTIAWAIAFCITAGAASAAAGGTELTEEQRSLQKIFNSRRSVRAFTDAPVPEAHLHWILDMARTAPTSGNQQPWKFLVIRDPQRIARLQDSCIAQALGRPGAENRKERIRKYYAQVFSAPVYVVVLVDRQSRWPDYNRHDGPLAAGYLILAARALGYGTVYYTDSIPEAVTRQVLEIPQRWERVCITPVGTPVKWPPAPVKRSLDSFIARESLKE